MAASVNPVTTGGGGFGVPEVSVFSTTKVMVNGDTLFTAAGDVQILNLYSECVTANGATASTLQYNITPTVGAATTISGASASLANVTAGTIVVLDGTALATAPAVTTSGVALAQTARGIIFPAGILTAIIGVGSTTGTWKHYIRYRPLEPGAYVY